MSSRPLLQSYKDKAANLKTKNTQKEKVLYENSTVVIPFLILLKINE